MRRIKINVKLVKSKRAQEGVFGLSFSTIFAIILIVFFIIVAFIAIKFFLDTQKKMQVGLFFTDFKNDVSEALNSNTASLPRTYTLPSGVKDVCIINLNIPPKNANNHEKDIYNYIFNEEGVNNFKSNVYLYAPNADYGSVWYTINNINTTERNPTCITSKGGAVSLKIERKYEGYSVYVSAN